MLRLCVGRNTIRVIPRYFSDSPSQGQSPQTSPSQSSTKVDVPGLSSAVVHPATQPVGPNVDPKKSGAYKVPEYFCYDNMSFFEAEIEMKKFRCPQPSAINHENL